MYRVLIAGFIMTMVVACEVSTPEVDYSSASAEAPAVTATEEDNDLQPPATAPVNGQADADVTFVEATLDADGTWTFRVTVEHPDIGWEDYADGWDVVLADGTVIKPDPEDPFTRLLLHPHENEQPFTRSQGGIEIPQGADYVTVRAHDIVDGFGGETVVVDLTSPEGDRFVVNR